MLQCLQNQHLIAVLKEQSVVLFMFHLFSVDRIESHPLKVLKKLTVDFSVFKEHSVLKERLS